MPVTTSPASTPAPANAESRPTAAVVAADAALRERLSALLRTDGLEVLVETSTADELAGAGLHPHVVVLGLEGTRARPLLRAARIELTSSRFVAVIQRGSEHTVSRALKEGIGGIVLTNSAPTTLAATVRAVAAGQLVVPREFERDLAPPALSNREKQVLGLVVLGFSNQEIAQKLFLAESTVKSHLYTAFGKLGVRSRQEAAAMILDSESGLGLGVLAINGSALASPA